MKAQMSQMTTDQLVLTVGYDMENLADPERAAAYTGPVVSDPYGRQIPKHGHGTVNLEFHHACAQALVKAAAELFDRVVEQSDVCILFYRWRKQWTLGAHFVALHRENGNVIGYNTYRNSTGPDLYGESLDGFLKQRKYFGCVLITIQNKKKEG